MSLSPTTPSSPFVKDHTDKGGKYLIDMQAFGPLLFPLLLVLLLVSGVFVHR